MLSIIIVNYKNPPLLRLCLKSLNRTLAANFPHEIIVIDSGSTIETEYVIEEFPGIKLKLFKENIGYTRGVNEGLKLAEGNKIFIANPDIIPITGSLEKMYGYLLEHPDVGILGPKLLNFNGTAQESCFRFYTPFTILCRRTFLGRLPFAKKTLNRFLMKDKNLNEITSTDWLMGSAYMVSREGVDKVGPLDERMFLYMSDVDWPRRFWENGFKVLYYPHASMYHYHLRESRGTIWNIFTNQLVRWHIKDALRYFKKYGLKHFSYV